MFQVIKLALQEFVAGSICDMLWLARSFPVIFSYMTVQTKTLKPSVLQIVLIDLLKLYQGEG